VSPGGSSQGGNEGDADIGAIHIPGTHPKCPAGGAHANVGSGNYHLAHSLAPTAGWQSNWRWCNKCQGLFFGSLPDSVCPAGGAHNSVGSADYSLYR